MEMDPETVCLEQFHKRGLGTVTCGREVKPGHDKCSLHVRTQRQRSTQESELEELATRKGIRASDAEIRAVEIANFLDMGRVYALDDGSIRLDELASKSLVRLVKSTVS